VIVKSANLLNLTEAGWPTANVNFTFKTDDAGFTTTDSIDLQVMKTKKWTAKSILSDLDFAVAIAPSFAESFKLSAQDYGLSPSAQAQIGTTVTEGFSTGGYNLDFKQKALFAIDQVPNDHNTSLLLSASATFTMDLPNLGPHAKFVGSGTLSEMFANDASNRMIQTAEVSAELQSLDLDAWNILFESLKLTIKTNKNLSSGEATNTEFDVGATVRF